MRVKKLRIITHDGEEVECEMLVCVLPYSNLIYCEAQLNQRQGELYKWAWPSFAVYWKET